MDKIQMFMMLHGGKINCGERSMWFIRDTEEWIVTGYRNKYDTPTLYKGTDIDKALSAIKGNIKY